MKINEKKSKQSKSTQIDDRQISNDFSEIFDVTENIEDIGSLFIDARVKKGLTQDDVGKILKVRVSYIKKIERGEELQSLGSVYSLGLLRSYAKLVDLEPEDIIKNYKSSNYNHGTKIDYNFPGVVIKKKSLLPIATLLTFVFSLVIYSSWYYLNLNDLQVKNENIADLNKNKKELDYVKIEDKLDNSLNSATKIYNENVIKTKKASSKMINNENSDGKVFEVVQNNKVEAENLLVSNKSKEILDNNETSAIANERTPTEEMVLKASGNSWVEIEDLDGNSYLTRLMRSGETFVVPDKKGLTLSTGNAGVLSLTFGSTHISKLGSVGEVISSRPLNIEAFKKR